MFNWFMKKSAPVAEPEPQEIPERQEPADLFSTHRSIEDGFSIAKRLEGLQKIAPRLTPAVRGADGLVAAMDSIDDACEQDTLKGYGRGQPNISDAIAQWFASQTFIGHQLAAIIAQHWLIAKVCDMPGRDAIRHGFTTVSVDGESIDAAVLNKIKRADKTFKLKKNLREFFYFGRVFGIRICIFKVDYGSDDANRAAYEAPFNIDGVRPGSYKGMVQVDPYWCSPELDAKASSQPDSMHFYEPTHWLINGVRYHRSHLCIYRHGAVADILKPAYLFGGVPVPQLIMERVYGAERTANEAPLLALTKRTVIYKTDLAKFAAKLKENLKRVAKWAAFWSNNGVRIIDSLDEHQQVDTSLSDMDALIMTQYQLVAAGGDVPATKLLGTQPKGFSATGEFDESSYHESLESLQEHEGTPFIEKHHQLVIKSEIPEADGTETTVSWEPLDSPTAVEWADINLKKSQTDLNLVNTGGIDGVDVRTRAAGDKDSGYPSLAPKAVNESETAVAIKAGVSPLGAAPADARP